MGELYDFFATDQTRRSKRVCATATPLTGGLWPGISSCPARRGTGRNAFIENARRQCPPVSATLPVALFSLEMQRKKVALNIHGHGERHRWHQH